MVSRRRRKVPPENAAAAAAAVRTLAVLLKAGARPLPAWQHMSDNGDPVAQRVVARCGSGASLPAALEAEGGTWGDVAAVWEVATIVGAPLTEVLTALSESLRDAAFAADEVRVALAEPAGTARLLLWLPFAGLLLGLALGFDTFGALFRTPLGGACLIAGVALVLLARWWTATLVRKARPAPGTPGLHAELLAVALSGGAGMTKAVRLVQHAARGKPDDQEVTERVLQLSRSAGVPAGVLLRATAAQQRQEARVQGRLRAAKLSSRLLLPLGACTLPAFLLLGVAPMLLSVLGATPLPI